MRSLMFDANQRLVSRFCQVKTRAVTHIWTEWKKAFFHLAPLEACPLEHPSPASIVPAFHTGGSRRMEWPG